MGFMYHFSDSLSEDRQSHEDIGFFYHLIVASTLFGDWLLTIKKLYETKRQEGENIWWDTVDTAKMTFRIGQD